MASKTNIDKAGRILSGLDKASEAEIEELEKIFDEYRRDHLRPLSETTLDIQRWLALYGSKYYFAQRLKRKPQIFRKLRRLSVRLTQLQDIGGSRIIVDRNTDVDKLITYLKDKVAQRREFSISRETDYRVRGRDDSGYRAVHLILEKDGLKLELQIRSRIQHYWAESIERTSVIYGHNLKELDGNRNVLDYFKYLSDLFYEIESGRDLGTDQKLKITVLRKEAEAIIQKADTKRVFDSFVNEGIIKTLIEKEKHAGERGLNNWIIVFNWNYGCFVSWDMVVRDPDKAINKYVECERTYPAEDGFEVVLVGSSEVATIRETHSHYFGLERHSSVLESLDESIVGFSSRMDIDVGARQILACMCRKRYWGKKTVTPDTLKNHYCKDVLTFDSSLDALIQKSLVHRDKLGGRISLDIKRKSEIESYL